MAMIFSVGAHIPCWRIANFILMFNRIIIVGSVGEFSFILEVWSGEVVMTQMIVINLGGTLSK